MERGCISQQKMSTDTAPFYIHSLLILFASGIEPLKKKTTGSYALLCASSLVFPSLCLLIVLFVRNLAKGSEKGKGNRQNQVG